MNEIEELLNWIEVSKYVGEKSMSWMFFLHDVEVVAKTKTCETLAEFFLFFGNHHAKKFFSKLREAKQLPKNLSDSIGHILLMDKL